MKILDLATSTIVAILWFCLSILIVCVMTGCTNLNLHLISDDLVRKPHMVYEQAINQEWTPGELTEYYKQYFRYEPDKTREDEYTDPKLTWERRYGDCDDFALLSYELLKKNYTVQVVQINRIGIVGHAICTIKTDTGDLYYTTNTNFVTTKGLKTNEQIGRGFYPNDFKNVQVKYWSE